MMKITTFDGNMDFFTVYGWGKDKERKFSKGGINLEIWGLEICGEFKWKNYKKCFG